VIVAVADGTTVTITIDGDDGVTNQLMYAASADADWTNGGQHVGDGDIVIEDLVRGTTYIFSAYSISADSIVSLFAKPAIITIAMPDADNIFDIEDRAGAEALLQTEGQEILYHPGGGSDQRAIDAIVLYGPVQDRPGGIAPVIGLMTRNSATRGISSTEFDRGLDEVTIATNIDEDPIRRPLVSMDDQTKGMITLEVN
jgi:hypothetical protein